MTILKTLAEIQIAKAGGGILAEIMQELKLQVKPGLRGEDLDKLAEILAQKYGVECAFKGYQGFPANICFSVNEELVHGLPFNKVLKEGDILSLDFGIRFKGLHFDMALTLPVGKVSPEAQRLIRVTKKSLKRGIKKAKVGNTVGDIGNTIERYVHSQGLGLVKELAGHGIGKKLHEDPQILNYGKRHKGEKLRAGMLICIEPMVTLGSGKVKKAKDGFTFVSEDHTLSAHFEHTVLITKEGPLVLTQIEE